MDVNTDPSSTEERPAPVGNETGSDASFQRRSRLKARAEAGQDLVVGRDREGPPQRIETIAHGPDPAQKQSIQNAA